MAERKPRKPASGRRLWKQAETEIATRLGGVRVPVSGRGRGDRPDIEHPRFAPEVKHTRNAFDLVTRAMAQAKAAAEGTAKVPLVAVHKEGQPYDETFVVLRLADFARLVETGREEDGSG